ncbi:hypothetical protein J437_LFUL007876 [Ladona fulva]|uniref:Uncharacterized protein n=1 Tax=Ladona fulva TaxID=123851 RepID=A0A8K0NVY5_LADFU|nr:hypothetical protein J437_LFUL007876 [Ladona fulva]
MAMDLRRDKVESQRRSQVLFYWDEGKFLLSTSEGAFLCVVLRALSYYCALTALSTYYFFASFSSELPWASCDPSWEGCFDSTPHAKLTASLSSEEINFIPLNKSVEKHSSSELYFL